jgi:hypothetical protein
MATKKQKILSAKKGPEAPTAEDQFAALKAKFQKLSEIRKKIAEAKALYAQHDAMVAELLPLFIKKTDKQFIIEREITLGTEIHKLVPYFYDDKKGILLAKQWKSTAFETATID